VSVLEIAANGSGVQTMQIIPQLTAPPLCEQDMLDVQPAVSQMSPSLIDLSVTWLERQPLPPPPPPAYFIIRYGPLVRQLVDDDRTLAEIIPGYETFVRTGQQSSDASGPLLPDPTREINVSGLQRSSLLKLQICAIYDPNSEPLIQWATIPSHRVDLAALEPFLELENTQTFSPMTSSDILDATNAAMGLAIGSPTDDSSGPSASTQIDQDQLEIPLVIAVEVDQNTSSTLYWITVMAGMMLLTMTALFVFICLRRMCHNRRRMVEVMDKQQPKSFIFVTTPPPPPPTFNEVMKVPIV